MRGLAVQEADTVHRAADVVLVVLARDRLETRLDDAATLDVQTDKGVPLADEAAVVQEDDVVGVDALLLAVRSLELAEHGAGESKEV
jgi:RNA binding exosome subunit